MAGKRTRRKYRFPFSSFVFGSSEVRRFKWRRRYPRYREEDEAKTTQVLSEGQPFGDETSLVNALRMRRIYRDVSLRLLTDLVDLGIDADSTTEGFELGADYELVQRAASSSACLYRSLRLRRKLSNVKERPFVHAVVVAREKNLDVPVDALTLLLAASLARQFGEVAAAVVFTGKTATAYVWIKSDLVFAQRVASYERLVDLVLAMLAKRGFGKEPFFHVFVAAGAAPSDIPPSFRGPRRARRMRGKSPIGYDRIVYLTRDLPDEVPGNWGNLLADILRPRRGNSRKPDLDGPFFSSFVATLVPDGQDREPSKFATRPIDAELQESSSKRPDAPKGWRIWRDACRLPLDPTVLEDAWDESADSNGSEAKAGKKAKAAKKKAANQDWSRARKFVDQQLKSDTVRLAVERWGRAVTNRRVGIALSGGGASSYRLVPLLKGLEEKHVPIDVVSGVSGGALLGAYYCARQAQGLDDCIKRGRGFTWAMLTAIVQPNRVSDVINKDLGGISIDETDVRFVAVTTALLEDDPPQTRAVSSGTLGEAAQASGAAPLLFKPVQVGDERFSDGASASLVPVRILKDCGADFVFGFNCLPGPPRRNPIDHRPGGQMLYERTAVGRLIDLWVSSGSMMQRLSREACEDAHVYFEPENDELFLIESVQFWKAREIEKKGADGVPPAVNDCVTMWKRLRR